MTMSLFNGKCDALHAFFEGVSDNLFLESNFGDGSIF